MRMNKTNYKQYDTRWAKLGYPKAPYYIKDCGCGEVSICNCIIESSKYADETPKTIQPYCKQYAAPNGDGTYYSGIPAMMKHYGMTEVKEHQTMKPLWEELAKGGRVAIYLMGSRNGGSKGVHWTSGGHFVCSVDYRKRDGKHEVYVKDSYSTSNLRNGWISYEENMRGDVLKVWSGRLPKTIQDKICEEAKKIADDPKYTYVYYSEKYGKECAICHPHGGKNKGWNCIGYAFACWHHAGVPCKCKCDVFTDQLYNKMLKVSLKEARRIARERIGCDDVMVLRNAGKPYNLKKLKKGDIVVYYTSDGYKHTALWLGDGKIADCTSGRNDHIKYGVKSYTGMTIKLGFRYTGK